MTVSQNADPSLRTTASTPAADHNVIGGMLEETDTPSPTPVPRLIDRLIRHLVENLGCDFYVRRRIDPTTDDVTLIESRGLSPEETTRMKQMSREGSMDHTDAIELGEVVLNEQTPPAQATRSPELDELRALGVRALYRLPILNADGSTDTCVFGMRTTASFSDQQRLWLETLATLITLDNERGADESSAPPRQELEAALTAMRGLTDSLEQRISQRTEALAHHHSQLRHLVSELVLTEQRERRRIAGELHDHLAQLLVACKMKLALVQSSLARPAAPPTATATAHDPGALLEEIDGFLNESLAYTRNLVAQISPVLLYEQGLLPALRWLAEAVMPRHGLDVTIDEQTDLAAAHLEEDVRVLLFQSVRELLFNVVKHAHVPHATMTVRECADESELEVVVSDNGTGFNIEQVRMTGGESQQGFGLLSVRERMTLLGGHFELSSVPDAGTRASVRVPLQPMPAQDAAPVELPRIAGPVTVERTGTGRGHLHVLVVDDHAVVREGLMMMLGKEEGVVIVGEAADGQTALELARQLRPHVVLMDVGLPDIDGIETTRRLTAAQQGIKIVGLSMHEDESTAAAMRAAGAVDYLCKGCSPDLLIDTIRRAVERDADDRQHIAANI